ncbi:MAG: glycine zipper 2TM domain-containing protein [Phenylobacterium sp.]|uniref:glycine zipper 2TM domain-containing protein n=1 Tax=Phenylobacterium sp. TaxID=1871053 RepID=UPI002717B6D5|nr:glycine zipper 2TM domain-containing protein [Phenylobacterium sp.]MDO9431490.1 glycine zipper 2TM domain-containing protein [Phenylobacterium sp.]
MNLRSTFAKSALAGVAGIMALGTAAAVPTFAAAQSSGYYGNNSYYDPCQRDSTNRSTVGALLGGALGAVVGSNAAARNARTEGALLGGALGALGGGVVGNRSAACNNGYRAPPRAAYNNGGNYNTGANYAQPYNEGYYAPANQYRPAPAYRGDSYNVTSQAPGATDGCSLAESPIYLPDGRTQKRFVRVCPDANGNYQVVD